MDDPTYVRLSHFQSLYAQVEQDSSQLRTILEGLPLMQQRLAELTEYYETQWLADYQEVDSFPSDEGSYSILSEDTIWNELYARQRVLNELADFCVQSLPEK